MSDKIENMGVGSGRRLKENNEYVNIADEIELIEQSLETDWHFTDTQPSGTDAEIVFPGVEGKVHFVSTIMASFEADNQAGKLELISSTEGSIFETFITGNPVDVEFAAGVNCGVGADLTLRLINDSNNRATVFFAGYTKDG